MLAARRFLLLPCVLTLGVCWLSAADVDPRAKKRIDELEKILPDLEKAADECEKAMAPLGDTMNATVADSVNAARLRIGCVHSLRNMIAQQPNFLIYGFDPELIQRWKANMTHYQACAKTAKDPYAGLATGTRAVRSPIDGQILFYHFRLPKNYDAKRKYPLDVELHAGAGLLWQASWVDRAVNPSREDAIYMSPCGRGNNSYVAMGEVAVMDAIRDVKRHYSVDENRVTIGGASMGGSGGFRMAALHPDVFAAAHSLTGGANYGVAPIGDGRYDATMLVDNFCTTGMCIWDAPKEGWYKQNHQFADDLRARAKQYAGSYSNLELTDPNGGHGIIDRKLQQEGNDWIRKQVRDPYPKRVVYKTYNLRYDGAYWARIDTVVNPELPARIEAELDGGKVRVAVENVDRFHLDLKGPLVGQADALEVAVNGGAAIRAAAGGTVYFSMKGKEWAVADQRYPAGLIKKQGLSGPVQDVFMDRPVLMVYGTREKREPAAAEKMVDEAVLRLLGPGDGAVTLHTGFRRKADRDVTKEDLTDHHLVLFGTPKQNELLDKMAGSLPVKFLPDGVEIAGKAHRGEGVGLVMVYPNPLNPERYVLLLPESYSGDSPMAYPDWLVVKTVGKGEAGRQQVLAKGNFSAKWK